MANADNDASTDPVRVLLELFREFGDALEVASPAFELELGAARLRHRARDRGLLPEELAPEIELAISGAALEEECLPFDVDAGAARLTEAGQVQGLLQASAEVLSSPSALSNLLSDLLPDEPRVARILVAATRDARVHDHVAIGLDEMELFADVLSAIAAVDRRLTDDEIDVVLGLRQARGGAPSHSSQSVPHRKAEAPASRSHVDLPTPDQANRCRR